MGGLGKTTLARRLYNNSKTEFTKHAWICVSQEWIAEDLFRKLIKELNNEEGKKVGKMELSELIKLSRELLEDRYLVVIDDMWHREAWEDIKKAFPENNNKSRIIITTRKEDVAELQDHTSSVHKLPFLGVEESWLLFRKKAFPGNNSVCPDHLEKLGKDMTAKCGGLPLAIIVLGGLLSRRVSHEWPEVEKHIWPEVKEDSIKNISPILDLSYDDLPSNIKSCFLYLGIFPEDALIKVNKLVKLWAAEGFIPINEEGRTPEEVSEYYFKELLRRNLVQTVERNWRMTSHCRVHDLVRDLAIKKARETNFLCVHDQNGSSFSSRTTSCRRFVVQSEGSAHEEFLNHLHKKVRTLHLLNDGLSGLSIDWSFRLLRVLQLERVNLSDERGSRLFEEVGEMIHLRYLGLKKTCVRKLPNTIGNLKVLQTLYIKEFRGLSLPKEIGKLKELRHLIGHFHVEDSPKLAGLSNLQTLELKLSSRALFKVNNYVFLAKLNNLRTLKIEDYSSFGPISIELLLSCKELTELKVDTARIEVPVDIHEYLPKLKYLQVKLSSELKEDPISRLELLPNLLVLHLSCYQQKTISWTFTAKGFPQLELLKLERVNNTVIHVEEGAMPRLRFLCVDNEVKQNLFPEKLRSLPGEEAMNWKFIREPIF